MVIYHPEIDMLELNEGCTPVFMKHYEVIGKIRIYFYGEKSTSSKKWNNV